MLNRFNSDYIAIFGVLLLFITPRVFGDSFQNNKDIIFLSFTIISTYFCFKILDNNYKRNIFLFCFFSAIATSIRLFGVFLPISLIVIQLLLVKKEQNTFLRYQQILLGFFLKAKKKLDYKNWLFISLIELIKFPDTNI